jgi:hypothetical protein
MAIYYYKLYLYFISVKFIIAYQDVMDYKILYSNTKLSL